MQSPQWTQRVTEDKLIILYALTSVKAGLTRMRLADIVLQGVQFNYFDLQRLIDELLEDNLLIEYDDEQQRRTITLSADGTMIINELFDSIPHYIRDLMDLYIEKNRDALLNTLFISAEYREISPGNFQAQLSLVENSVCLMSLNLNTPTKQDAVDLCKKWKEDPQKIYAAVIRSFNF